MKDGSQDLTDPDQKSITLSRWKGLNVLPLTMGKMSVWISTALGNPAMIKKEAEDRGLKESSAEIPTCGVKLALSHNAMGTGGKYRPVVITVNPVIWKGWGMYPLLQVRIYAQLQGHLEGVWEMLEKRG